MRRQITFEQFQQELKAQQVPRIHVAVKCPMCKTVQSMHSLLLAGVEKSSIESIFGFSCIGRYKNKQEHAPGVGCDWSLGGLFQMHELEVIAPDNKIHRFFKIASMDEAKTLMESEITGAV